MKGLITFYLPSYPSVLIYMLQSTEYQVGPYLSWYWRTDDFSKVMKRRALQRTKAARLLLVAIRLGMLIQIVLGLGFLWLWYDRQTPGAWQFGLGLLISYPMIWAHVVVLPLILGRILIVRPKERRLIAASKKIFADHPGTKIAVAGSYGKTTMKELLGTVLSESKNVAITPANKNVASSHAVFAAKLTGKEDVLVIEYGEGAPGDVRRFAETTKPNIGIITGVAPAHLDKYPTLKAAGKDIFSLAAYLHDNNVYVNGESEAASELARPEHTIYGNEGVAGWSVHDVEIGFEGTNFTLKRDKQKLHLKSGLLGRHQIGPLAAVAAIADNLGLTKKQIEEGVAKTMSFEHRMQPRQIGGAWVIDDTYNGNIDGIQAGLNLLKELPAKRKIYVTPGLVDQGVETERVHHKMGNLIADVAPDMVVLMDNSATAVIAKVLKSRRFQGEVRIEDDPLEFYTNLAHFVAAGDVVLMQNDWTDNYN